METRTFFLVLSFLLSLQLSVRRQLALPPTAASLLKASSSVSTHRAFQHRIHQSSSRQAFSSASIMANQNGKSNGQNKSGGAAAKQSSQGHELKEPPNTGWKGPIPAQNGGREEGYLQKPPYSWQSKEFEVKYTAKCWCGKLEFEYHGDPIDAKHCHCTQCQRLHGAPFQWAALFHKTSVRLAQHCDPLNLDFFSTQEGHSEHSVPCKISCRNCRSPMADEGRNMVMAYPSSFVFKDHHVPAVFAPTAHIFYGERVMDLDDDIPKWAGHKNSSEQLPHAPKDETDRTMGKGKRHKANRE